MIQITCDLCGKSLSKETQSRFVVRVESFVGSDPSEFLGLTESDLDVDHLEAISEQIAREGDAALPPAHQSAQFDLCQECRDQYMRDPLGRRAFPAYRFGASRN